MLVLSAKVGERIYVGNDICVTLVRAGEKVRIGFEAPKDVVITRAVLLERPPAAFPGHTASHPSPPPPRA